MKQLLSIFIAVLVAITAFGQSNPPNKLRSNDSFTQVDNYLVAAKRLGIPTGDTPTLNASTTSQNSAKLFYNTTDESLYVYDAVSETWNQVSADIDLSNFYTIAQVDSAINSKASPFNLIDVTQLIYADKAINVIAFDNTGMSYQEGSIDFGITRASTHTMGLYAFKQGLETTASGVGSSAFGYQTTASDDYSLAFGSNTTASGAASLAFGFYTTASGPASSAFGNQTTASGRYSSAFGDGSIANEYASLAIGQYSTDGPVQTSWVTGSPIFKVGNGTGNANRSNAYVLYNDGRSEQVKDIEVTEIGYGVVIKSPDGTRWRITVDNTGTLSTTSL